MSCNVAFSRLAEEQEVAFSNISDLMLKKEFWNVKKKIEMKKKKMLKRFQKLRLLLCCWETSGVVYWAPSAACCWSRAKLLCLPQICTHVFVCSGSTAGRLLTVFFWGGGQGDCLILQVTVNSMLSSSQRRSANPGWHPPISYSGCMCILKTLQNLHAQPRN